MAKYSSANVKQVMEMTNCSEQVAKNALNSSETIEQAINLVLNSPPQDDLMKAIQASMTDTGGPGTGSTVAGVGSEDVDLNRAIMESMQTNNSSANPTYEPLPIIQRKRKEGIPVGLKNVGNTCYFNSLIQTYFYIPHFYELIMNIQVPEQSATETSTPENPENKEQPEQVQKCKMIKNLKYLFATLVKSNKKYSDASPVLNELKDEYGRDISIGEQNDVSEFHLKFISWLEKEIKSKYAPDEEKKEEKKPEEETKQSSVPEQPDLSKNQSSLDDPKESESSEVKGGTTETPDSK